MTKRSRTAEDNEEHGTPKRHKDTPKKQGASTPQQPHLSAAVTPSGRKSALRGTPTHANGFPSHDYVSTPSKKVLFSAPLGPPSDGFIAGEIAVSRRNDHSARKASARALDRQRGDGAESDEELNADDARVAATILNSDEEDESAEEDIGDEIAVADPATPSRTGRPRGRPRGKRRERTPSPPPDLPPHELYFFQNRAGTNKTSANHLPPGTIHSREDYKQQIESYHDHHELEIQRLKKLHQRAFEQWAFELDQRFNICLYGLGSKRDLLSDFAEHLYFAENARSKIVVVNGYIQETSVKDVLGQIASLVLPRNSKFPTQPAALLDVLLNALSDAQQSSRIILLVNSLDYGLLRKSTTQSIFARLASHPKVSVVASCDNPNFALLWDLHLMRQFNFLFHDATTYAPYAAEIDVVEEVNVLLGRSSRRLAGKDGVGYVLRSLPENARNLFRMLVVEQMALMDSEPDARLAPAEGFAADDDDDLLGASDDELAANQQDTPSRRGRGRPRKKAKSAAAKSTSKPVTTVQGVEYRTLYHKAVEDFVCSSEINFRTLLKEFHDHQMIESRKDAMGTERLVVPFRREELEAILEEL